MKFEERVALRGDQTEDELAASDNEPLQTKHYVERKTHHQNETITYLENRNYVDFETQAALLKAKEAKKYNSDDSSAEEGEVKIKIDPRRRKWMRDADEPETTEAHAAEQTKKAPEKKPRRKEGKGNNRRNDLNAHRKFYLEPEQPQQGFKRFVFNKFEAMASSDEEQALCPSEQEKEVASEALDEEFADLYNNEPCAILEVKDNHMGETTCL